MHAVNIALARQYCQPSSRRAVCTHIKVSRSFNADTRCLHCGRTGDQAPVYRCTQDSDGRISLSQSGLDAEQQERLILLAKDNEWTLPGHAAPYSERLFRAEDDTCDISVLKPWMIKAISFEGYTLEQITKLVVQRMHAKDAMRMDELQVKLGEQNKFSSLRNRKPGLQRMPITGRLFNAVGHDGQQEKSTNGLTYTETVERPFEPDTTAYRRMALCEFQCCIGCR